VILQRGQPKPRDTDYVIEFSKYEQIAGFVGYELGDITALGFYRYMCDSAPPPEPVDKDTEPAKTDIDCAAMGMEMDAITKVCYVI